MPDDSWARHPFPPNRHVHFSPLKRVQTRKDSDNVEHYISVQTEEMSCGPASVAMVIETLKHGHESNDLAFTDMRLKKIAAQFPGSMAEQDARWQSQGPKSGHEGSQLRNMVDLLQSQKVPIKELQEGFAFNKRAAAIKMERIRSGPGLLLWGWYDHSYTRLGGHFTVAARTTKSGKAVILDPWDGSLSEVLPLSIYRGSGLLDCAIYTK